MVPWWTGKDTMQLLNRAEGSSSRVSLLRGQSGAFVLALLALSLVVRLIPAYFVYGSFDVGTWGLVIREYRIGHNPYTTGKLNWPPLWPMLLFYTMRMEDVYNLPTHFAVKILPCLADSAIAIALYLWFARSTGSPSTAFKRSLWYALNPVAIATCALHGQFESLPSLFTLLAVMEATRARPGALPFRSAIWLGLGGMAKTWPLFLMPAFLRGMRSWRKQVVYVLIAVAPTVLSVWILYLQAPEPIVKNVLSYRSSSGQWGLTAINFWLTPEKAQAWSHVVIYLLYTAWLAIYLVTWRKGSTGQIAILGVLTFYVFTPGWGPQYFAWVLGIAILADFPRARIYTVLATLNLAILYIYSPYNGEYFDFLRRMHSDHFWNTYLDRNSIRINTILFLPLWLFSVGWLFTLLRDVFRQPNVIESNGVEGNVILDTVFEDTVFEDNVVEDNVVESNGVEDNVVESNVTQETEQTREKSSPLESNPTS
jgi:hypothetical protein